jgi:hypothetical protein
LFAADQRVRRRWPLLRFDPDYHRNRQIVAYLVEQIKNKMLRM